MKLSSPLPLILLALLYLGVGAADAATIYRWVDKQGNTHFSGVVPEAYKDVAEPVEQTAAKPSLEERQRAIERANEQKADAAAKASSAALGAAPASSVTAPEKAGGTEKRPAKAPTEDTDCETWKRLFQESGECFGPYRLVGGGVKKEAFEHCTPVVQPPGRCRPNLR